MKWRLILLLCLLAGSAQAAEMPSLFFTPAEMQKIEAPGAAAPPSADIQLGAVLFYGGGNWTVWLDGERWTPATRRADLRIIDVWPDHVMLQLAKGPLQPIILRSHQRWQAASGKVIEAKSN